MYEVSGITGFKDIPGFRNLTANDIPSLDASKITTGQLALARGGTGSDLSATGGASQVLKQTTLGGAVTVAQEAFSDLSGNIAVSQMNTGTGASSSTFFRGDGTWSGLNSNSVALTAQTASVAATNLIPTPSTTALYQITYALTTTTAGTGGTVSLTLTWNNGAAQTVTTANVNLNTLGAFVSGTQIIKATSGIPQYSTTVAGAAGGPQYSLDIRVLPLG
jgi:hypothetical protein